VTTEDTSPTVLITGAAGNLGGMLARHLAAAGVPLRLMTHRTPVADDLAASDNTTVVLADLARPETLAAAVAGAEVVVHFAGVLFAPRPEKFLPETNTRWFGNLLDACLAEGVRRVVLVSFPHVEGPTTIDRPATGRLDSQPISVHATTRLAEERLLMDRTDQTSTTPVVLRLGMVYGRGVLMIEAARWLARRRLLAVWRQDTWIQLISTPDFLAATEAAALLPGIRGIYHVGDEQPVTLQHFLDEACRVWGCRRPRRLPLWMIYTAAQLCEWYARLFGTRAPLTKDFVTIGRVPYWGDTTRTRRELLPSLKYPTLREGLATLE